MPKSYSHVKLGGRKHEYCVRGGEAARSRRMFSQQRFTQDRLEREEGEEGGRWNGRRIVDLEFFLEEATEQEIQACIDALGTEYWKKSTKGLASKLLRQISRGGYMDMNDGIRRTLEDALSWRRSRDAIIERNPEESARIIGHSEYPFVSLVGIVREQLEAFALTLFSPEFIETMPVDEGLELLTFHVLGSESRTFSFMRSSDSLDKKGLLEQRLCFQNLLSLFIQGLPRGLEKTEVIDIEVAQTALDFYRQCLEQVFPLSPLLLTHQK